MNLPESFAAAIAAALRPVFAEHRRETEALFRRAGLLPEGQWLTRKQAAARMGIGLRTLDERLAEGALPYSQDRKGGRVRIRAADLDRYLEEINGRRA